MKKLLIIFYFVPVLFFILSPMLDLSPGFVEASSYARLVQDSTGPSLYERVMSTFGAAKNIILTFIAVIVIIGLFLICREIFCWYWKINERVLILREIRDLLNKQIQGNGAEITSTGKDLPSDQNSKQEE